MANFTDSSTLNVEFPGTVIDPTLPLSDKAATDEVVFPDPILASKIRAYLGIASGDPITQGKLDTIVSLAVVGAGITNIEGLGSATNLQQLSLSQNSISDVSPLNGLSQLNFLILDNNDISDLSTLTDLPAIAQLKINYNHIVDISPVNKFSTLTLLGADYNEVSDISSLTSLVNMTQFSFVANKLTDISVVSNYPNLQGVYFSDNALSSIEALRNRPALQVAVLNRIGINDFYVLQDRMYLGRVEISGNNVTDLSFLYQSRNFLVNLVAESNHIGSLWELQDAAHLQILALYDNPELKDISPLNNCPELKQLFIPNTGVTDISTLNPGIMILATTNDAIADYSPLANLNNLVEFHGDNTGVTDPSFLNGLSLLSFVFLDDNHISDLRVVKQPLPVTFSVEQQTVALAAGQGGTATHLALFNPDGSVPDITWLTPGTYDSAAETVTWDNAGSNKLTWKASMESGYEFSGTVTQTTA